MFRRLLINYGNLFILRHGQTTPNAKGYWYNDDEEDINSTGIEQARSVAEKIRIIDPEVVFSSPLRRCVHTAELVLDHANPSAFILNPGLSERYLKALEGLDSAGIREKYDVEMDFPTSTRIDHLPDIERSDIFRNRVNTAFEEIMREGSGKRILVITHGGVMWAFLDIYLGMHTIKPKTFNNCALLGVNSLHGNFVPTLSVNMREDWYSHVNPSWRGLPL